MKYFRPELFNQLNSNDPAAESAATEAWEQAVEDHDAYLKSVRGKLPAALRKLANLHLHDATVADAPAATDDDVAVFVATQGPRNYVLIYTLLQKPKQTRPIPRHPYSEQALHWLYDELEVVGRQQFQHRVLLSDGRVVSLMFQDVKVLELSNPVVAALKRA